MDALANDFSIDGSGKDVRQPKVNANASTPESRNSISNWRSAIRSRLSNQLIQALLGDRASTLVVYVTSMACARRLSIEEHSKKVRLLDVRQVP
jgi:hypothetical protein